MNKGFRKFLGFIIALNLVLASFSGVTLTKVFADAQNIEVTPYPKTALERASYRVTFNINESLKAGSDSIRVVFPKETNIDSTISSANISVNPKLLKRADLSIDYQSGTVNLFNPLREGDRVVADYRYQPGPQYTQLPRNVMFFDQTYPMAPATTDIRRGNGVLDAGEWIYEDRDNDGMISIGDKRLCVIVAINGAPQNPLIPNGGSATYRQGSLVQATDEDFVPSAADGSVSTQALTSYSVTNLYFVDKDDNGVYSENDWLVDDKDGSGTLNMGDQLIAGIFWYTRGTTVASTDLDALSLFVEIETGTAPNYIHTENPNGNPNLYDDGEYIYLDVNNNGIVNVGDVRLTPMVYNLTFYPRASLVAVGDPDENLSTCRRFTTTPTIEMSSPLFLEHNETIAPDRALPYRNYRHFNNVLPATIVAGDLRTSNIQMAKYLPQSVVSDIAPFGSDANKTLFSFSPDEKFFGNSPAHSTMDPIYRDVDKSGRVSEGDIRLTEVRLYLGPTEFIYTAGSVVRNHELDFDRLLTNFPAATSPTVPAVAMHTEDKIPNGQYDLGEMIYHITTATTITNGANRQFAYGVISANIAIGSYYPDAGLTLTKGWADIINEPLIESALGGERTLKLRNYPVIMPILPKTNDSQQSREPLTIPGNNFIGNLRGSGFNYYLITATINTNPMGESEPWEERSFEFSSAIPSNALRLRWSPVPGASGYRIYRTREAGNYDESSLIAIVTAPTTEYIDLGYESIIGSPSTNFTSSFSRFTRTRRDPNSTVSTDLMLKEYELADYKLETKSGRVEFRRPLKALDTIIADYDIGVPVKDEVIYIDSILGRGKLRNKHTIEPRIFGNDEYEIKIRKATAANPSNPTLLVRGIDYDFLDEKNDAIRGLEEGMIVFKITVDPTDTIYADYVYRKEVRGDLILVANGNETSRNTSEKNIIPGEDFIFKGRTLSSAPMLNVVNSEKGFVIQFTTPVNIRPNPLFKNNPAPNGERDVRITFSLQTGIRNPRKAGNYQLFVQTSKEQTDIYSNPYAIESNLATQQLIKLTQDQSVSAGSTIALTTAVRDELSNNIPNVTVVYNLLSSPGSASKLDKTTFVTDSSGNAVAMLTTSPTPGDNTVQAKILGTNTVVVFKITGLSTLPISKVTITPASMTLAPKGATQYTATAYDNSGNIVPNMKFTWSVTPPTLGTITENGYFSATEVTGTGTINAEAYGIKGMSNITITQSSTKVEKVVITPKLITTGINKTVQFSAMCYDGLNNLVPNASVNWTVSPVEIGTISSLGLFTAKTLGTGNIMVTSVDGGKYDVASVTVAPSIARVAISPETAVMNVGEVKQFTAIVYDESNQLINNANLMWSTRGDIGLITNTGIFTAQRKGMGQVVVSVDGKEATSIVTVNESNVDKVGPIIIIFSPQENSTTTATSLVVQGNVKDPSGVKYVKVNGLSVPTYNPVSGDFTSSPIMLNSGNNSIMVSAEDNLGNISTKTFVISMASPIVINLQIGNRSAIIIRDGMPSFVTIDLAPFTKSGRTMVPLRFIAEAFGAKVNWIPDVPATGEGGIEIELNKSNGSRIKISMHTNSKFIKKQVWAPGATQPTDEFVNYDQNDPAPFVVKPQGRTVVPLRFIAETFGAIVDWKADTQEIKITFAP
jgi:hypothetical protein